MSGRAVLDALGESGHVPIAVRLDRQGRWHFPPASDALAEVSGFSLPLGLGALVEARPDVVFLGAFHGQFGEDGRVQGLLECAGLRYTGSGVRASANAFDKPTTKQIYRLAGVPVAEDWFVTGDEARRESGALAREAVDRLGLPLVIKTPAGGSSVGVYVARDLATAIEGTRRVAGEDGAVLFEAFVSGRELTAPVLERADGTAEALPLVEIIPIIADFFDYEAKYQQGGSREISPAEVDPELTHVVQELGLRAHEALGCAGISRTDVMLGPMGPVVLETNTLPGMTPASLFPKSAAAAGMSFAALVDRIARVALRGAAA